MEKISHKTHFLKSDGGRSLCGYKEKNDCSVRAVAIAYNVGYPQAHLELSNVGRKQNRGVYLGQFNTLISKLGCLGHEELRPRKTLKRVIRENPKGRFILRCRGHIFALIDGVVHDNGIVPPGTRITNLWRIA